MASPNRKNSYVQFQFRIIALGDVVDVDLDRLLRTHVVDDMLLSVQKHHRQRGQPLPAPQAVDVLTRTLDFLVRRNDELMTVRTVQRLVRIVVNHPSDGLFQSDRRPAEEPLRVGSFQNQPGQTAQLIGCEAQSRQLAPAAAAQIAVGESSALRRTPAPDMPPAAMEPPGADPDKTVFVGDSEVDIATARAADLPCISVLWGFRDRDVLARAGAQQFAADIAQLQALLG